MPEYRLKYEMSRLGLTTATGFADTYDFPQTGTSTEGSPVYDVTSYIEDPDTPRFTFGVNGDQKEIEQQLTSNSFERSVSSDIAVFGLLDTYFRDWLVNNSDSGLNSIKVKVTDVVCNLSMGVWQIEQESIKWCEGDGCKLTANLIEYTPTTNCLQNTLIDDNHQNWFPDNGVVFGTVNPTTGLPNPPFIHPRFRYCDEIHPLFLQNFLFVIANGIALAIGSIVGPILLIADAIQYIWNQVFGSGTTDFADDLEDSVNALVGDWFEALLSCGRMHPAPLIRNYFINACKKCGVEFESDLFNDESMSNPHRRYYNACYLYAKEKWGVKDDSQKDWIKNNAPYHTVSTLAYELRELFNAKYRLRNGVFELNHVATFNDAPIFDFTGVDIDLLIEPICYNADTLEGKVQATYWEYSQDSIDWSGNMALHRYNGSKIWTLDFTRFKGNKVQTFENFSVARFTTDGIERKLAFRKLDDTDFWEDSILLLEKDATTLAKILIWDGESNETAQVVRVEFYGYPLLASQKWTYEDWAVENAGSFPAGAYSVFNSPMFFDPVASDLVPFLANMYDLHKVDDPTNSSLQNKNFSIMLELCCATLSRLVFDDTSGDGLQTYIGDLIVLDGNNTGEISSVEIDYGAESPNIKISGKVKYSN